MKKAFVSLFIVLFVLAFSACGKRTEEAKLSALGKNEALIPGAEPCCTAEEARKAGLPLSEVPFDTQANEENGLESVTYSVENEKFSLELSGQEVEGGLFQFVNGKLSNITLNLSDGAACEAVKAEMTEIYGEPAAKEEAAGAVLSIWEFQGEYPVQAAVIERGPDGENISGSFQVSYFWFEDGERISGEKDSSMEDE